MSHMPFAEPATFELRQHLADTTIGPAEMFGLALVYSPNQSAVAVLCEHAAGSFRLLAGCIRCPGARHDISSCGQPARPVAVPATRFYLLSRERPGLPVSLTHPRPDLLEGFATRPVPWPLTAAPMPHQPSPHVYFEGFSLREAPHQRR